VVWNCLGLAQLPELPKATKIAVSECPNLTRFNAGFDSRFRQFVAVQAAGGWRIIAGCRNLSFEEARDHWAENPEALALVEKLAREIATELEV
jgi:hypothetical protein